MPRNITLPDIVDLARKLGRDGSEAIAGYARAFTAKGRKAFRKAFRQEPDVLTDLMVFARMFDTHSDEMGISLERLEGRRDVVARIIDAIKAQPDELTELFHDGQSSRYSADDE